MSANKLLDGEGDGECVNEVLGWIIYTEAGAVSIPEQNIQELRELLDIPTTHRHMGRKYLERLVGNLCYMHLAVPGAVVHIHHIERAIAQAGADRAWLSPEFHHEIAARY